ncbi:MAG: methyltransferase domain-containing protein [Flavobacteriaceae bacterium]|jgi:SAM-dependent methyltransferase|nr:methyltransferase domain-containing protein [Flavobacteriaceae bacterium]
MLYSKLNKFKDSIKFDKHRTFRKELLDILKNHHDEQLYDYGEGYFYQSSELLNISGLRNSSERVDNYNLNNITKGSCILDIGCNSGFLDFEIIRDYKKIVGIDHNKLLIKMANLSLQYLNLNNIEFYTGDFLSYYFEEKFDIILSLANHSTFDKGIVDTEKYFSRCFELLNKKGHLIIESHHPNYENTTDFLELIAFIITKYKFKLIEKKLINSTHFYDNKRMIVKLMKT